jgi:hypothetical protein
MMLMKFIKTNDDGTIYLTAPVLIPNARDCDYHNGETPLTEEQIKAFKESYERYGFVDHEHGLTRDGRKIGEPHESILLDHDTTFTTFDGTETMYPSGTWLLTTHITDDEAISEAMKGYYTGYSPSILPRASADKYLEALKSGHGDECSCKNQISSMGNSLIKDVPDPVVLSVSLTRQPCLHESKFCKLSDTMENQEEVSLKSKILTAMGMSEEAEVVALKSEVSELKGQIEEMRTTFEESLKSMQEEFKQTLTEALTPVDEVAEKASIEPANDAVVEEEAEAIVEEAEEKEEEGVVVEEKEEKEEEEKTVEEEPEKAEKGESKAEPVHDNIAEKTETINIYKIMGRNADGTRRH